MAGSIASLNVRLIADIGGFAAGMTAAVKPLTSFVGSIGSAATSVGGLMTALTGLAAGGASLAGLAELTRSSMESIDATAKLSDRLGVTTEALTGLQHGAKLAGIDSEELTGGLEKMLKSLGEAANGGGPAAEALQRMGLSAKALANESPDAAFKQIAAGIAKIHNPTERATAALQLFGKSGQSLLPLLMQGSEGIAAAQREAEKLGLSFSRVDAHQVEQANEAITRLKAVFTGVGNQLAIQLAPIIEAIVTKFTDWASTGEGIQGTLRGAIKSIAFVMAEVGDTIMSVADWAWGTFSKRAQESTVTALTALKGVLEFMAKLEEKTTGSLIFSSMASGVDTLIGAQKEGIKANDELLAAWRNNTFGDQVSKFFEDVDNKAAKTAKDLGNNKVQPLGDDFLDNAKKIQSTLDDLQKQVRQFGMTDAEKKVDDLKGPGATPDQVSKATGLQRQLADLKTAQDVTKAIEAMQKDLATVNMTDAQKKLFDFSQIQGIKPKQIQQLKALSEQLDAAQAAKKHFDELQSAGKRVMEENLTPIEKYENQIGKLGEMLNAGVIDWNTYGRAVRKARGELEDAAEAHHPDAVTVGSAEAQRGAYDRSRGAAMANDLPRQSFALQQRADRFLDNIERNTRTVSSDGGMDI